MNIKSSRNKINKIDKQIIKSLKQRMKIAEQIGKYKKKNKISIEDKEREKQILKEYKKTKGIDKDFLTNVFKLIINHSKKIQRKIK